MQRSWGTDCLGCLSCLQLFWFRVLMRKWLNISAKESDYSADTDVDKNSDSDSDVEEFGGCERPSMFQENNGDGSSQVDPNDTVPRRKRRKSETFRAQYINTKELRICVGTWNAGGKVPPDDYDIEDWLDISEPADIYVIGLQEIVPLNAGNVLGAEDKRPVPKWENIIRETLNRIRHRKTKVKCYSDHPSPSRFRPFEEFQDIEELSLSTDSEGDEEIHPVDDDFNAFDVMNYRSVTGESVSTNPGISGYTEPNIVSARKDFRGQSSLSKGSDRLSCLGPDGHNGSAELTFSRYNRKLSKTFNATDKIGLSWTEPSFGTLARHVLESPRSFKSMNSFKTSKSLRAINSFKSVTNDGCNMASDLALLAEVDLESLMNRRRKSSFVRIVSKQMVGIFLTVWVRRSLRRHIQNVKVSTVGVGVMGYIGNKGSISVSMAIYQTQFCFICTHLTSGEKDVDQLKRNGDVQEILRRTQFHTVSEIGLLPKSIHDHERIIWLGDLNYRINLPHEKVKELVSKREWSELAEHDQLTRELKKGRAFDGWSEGILKFPPTYKYEFNSLKYIGGDLKVRRTPAWCDRILSYGKGMRLLNYRRTELMHSDHRPVTATYMAEVEVFSPRKLQRALTFTDYELEEGEIATDMEIDVGMSRLRL